MKTSGFRPKTFLQLMGFLRASTEARTRLSLLRSVIAIARSTASGAVIIPQHRASFLRQVTSDSKSNVEPQKTDKTDIAKPHRSILEEVLIKEQRKPRTATEKSIVLSFFFNEILLFIESGFLINY